MKAKALKKKSPLPKTRKPKNKGKKSNVETDELKDIATVMQGGESDQESNDEENLVNASKMDSKEYLEKLKKNDPEFYKVLMQSKDLLEGGSSGDDDDEKEEDDEDDVSTDDDVANDEDMYFKPPEVLKDMDDESEDEEVKSKRMDDGKFVTFAMISKWQEELKSPTPLNAFREVEQALLAAIESLSGHDKGETLSRYEVESPQMFNAIVKLCLQNISTSLQRILKLKNPDDDPMKSKKWPKVKNFVKPYLQHMVKLTESIADPEIAVVVLKKGILPLLGYYSAHVTAGKVLIRRLITLWCTSHQRVRVLAFVAILRITKSLKTELLDNVLKRMYLSYVQNCRFTSPSTWGMIDFMRLSLVELYAIDKGQAYRHAFIYIRQMAFHLRNANLIKKKEKIAMVYNWQFIHCLHLWTTLLARTHPDPILQPLIYPITQIAIGTMKLQSSPKYAPLVYHVCDILTEMSGHTNTFIPVAPFLLEVLNTANLNKRHQKNSIRPFQWICMLKLSKSQMLESAYKDGIVDQFYNGILKYLNYEAASIGFPELVVPLILQLKSFLKTCKGPNYTKKVKQLLEKVNENSKFISDKRNEVRFNISDLKAIGNWEIETRQQGTPITNYYSSWSKTSKKSLLKQISRKDELDNYDLPVVKKKEVEAKRKGKPSDNPFDTDDDDSMSDDSEVFLTKEEKAAKKKGKQGKADDDGESSSEEDEQSEEDDDSEEGVDSEEGDDSEEDDDDSDGKSDNENEPPKKKAKRKTKKAAMEEESEDEILQNGSKDVVKVMDLSDMETDDSDQDDEFNEVDSDDSDEE